MVKKDGCLYVSRESGMEANVKPSREIYPKGGYMITFSFVVGVATIIGAVAGVGSFVLSLYRKKKK